MRSGTVSVGSSARLCGSTLLSVSPAHLDADGEPVLAVYCPSDSLPGRSMPLLSAEENVARVTSWAALQHAACEARCVVLVVPWLAAGSTVARIAALRRRIPGVPVVVATTKDADNLRYLARCPVDEIVWLQEIGRELPVAVRRACATGVMVRVARAFAAASDLPPVLRDALEYACCTERPVRSVSELAIAIGKHPHTLWYHWHRTVADTAALRLEDCLDWILLLRAWHLRECMHGWEYVARKLHVHENTLARLIRRLTARTPGQLARLERPVVLEMADHVLRDVIGTSPLREAASLADVAPVP